ncbi:MAG: ISAs1 family transposase [Chitinophagales bacterium]
MAKSLYEAFAEVKDTRNSSGLRHPLQPFLTMVTLGIMSGRNAYQELAKFFKGNQKELVELFNLKHGVPGYTQTRTILRDIDYDSLCKAFTGWALQFIPLEEGDWVSGDGKGLNSTVTNCHNSKQNFISMVSFFAQKTGTVLAVKRYENGKAAEMTMLQDLLSQLKGKGVIITLDALHCQKKQLPPS